MRKKIMAATMAVVLMGAGAAFAGAHYGGPGMGPGMGPGAGQGWHGQGARMRDLSWLEQAPKNVQDAFKQIDISHSEMRLEIAKGNTDRGKLSAIHNSILKARRTVADYYFDQALKNPAQAGRFMDGRYQRMGMRMMGGGFHGGMFAELRNELSKANPDTAKAKQIYKDMVELTEKHAKERFELMLKYPESMNMRYRGPGF